MGAPRGTIIAAQSFGRIDLLILNLRVGRFAAYAKASERAGLEKTLGPHALRRACATEMIRRDANPWHVKELLGHEDFRSLDAYVKLAILDLKAAHRRCHPREQARSDTIPGEVPPG